MNLAILEADVQDFIDQNLDTSPTTLILKGVSFNQVTTLEIVEQIEAKNKCELKLPTWFAKSNIYYPNKLNIEQTSSELTAQYKAGLIEGRTLIDLTGGFGVDAFYFSKVFDHVTYCELNPELQEIAKHNFNVLSADAIEVLNKDGIKYLNTTSLDYDWIYIDPSRRHESKGKVFFLKDCLPNIPAHLNSFWSISNNIMIKTSPLLDITSGTNELEYVKSIHIVAVNNEVKEILWILEYGFNSPMKVFTTNLKKRITEHFVFHPQDESRVDPAYSSPLTYLYEPNAAILKSGGFNSLIPAYKVRKLHKHSHLYTSEMLIDFPGRTFKIERYVLYNKKKIKSLSIRKANITTRNFPETVENLRKQFKIKDGGVNYLFFTTNLNNEKIVLICTKVTI